jgi:hypothetical protein
VLPTAAASGDDSVVAQAFAASDIEHAAYVAGDLNRLQKSKELFL